MVTLYFIVFSSYFSCLISCSAVLTKKINLLCNPLFSSSFFIQFLQRPFTPNDDSPSKSRFVTASSTGNKFIEKFDHEANYNRDFPNNRRKSQPTHPDYEQYEQFAGGSIESLQHDDDDDNNDNNNLSFVSDSKLVSITKKSAVIERSMVSESMLMFAGDKSMISSIIRPTTGGAETQVDFFFLV